MLQFDRLLGLDFVRKILVVLLLSVITHSVKAQLLMDVIDTSKTMGKGFLKLYQKFDRIYITGYLQPQFQVAQKKGIKNYSGGDFPAQVSNRFMLRRGRVRFDYERLNKDGQLSVYFVFQFDGTERGVNIRDFWGRIYENKWQYFSFTTGMFARPFGFEINLSSSDRETPERGRMSQILMKTERDLGAMVSFEPRRKDHPLRQLKIDAGFFNGQGLTSTQDYDSYKDFIARASLKPYQLSRAVSFAAGLSYLNGGLLQNNRYINTIEQSGDFKQFVVDSSISNIGGKAPRVYYGVDARLKLKGKAGVTELRAEYWWGKQTASAGSSETPTALLQEPYYIRNFDGAFIYLLHTIKDMHQFGVKCDWYDPNTKVTANDIGKAGTNINATNIKYTTISIGYNNYINENLKLFLWYDIVRNESTQLADYAGDIKDNVFTARLQFRF